MTTPSIQGESSGASREAIEFHYDVGSDFYALWLDPTLTYSSALWLGGEGQSLADAQRAKLDYYAVELRAQDKESILDIGCGWGSMAMRLTQQHGVQSVVGLTLSSDQASHIRAMAGRTIEVRLEPWQQHRPNAPYDGVVSIGAFEHFARPSDTSADKIATYRKFFAACHSWSKPRSRLCVQTICYDNASSSDLPQFFRDEVFPQSDLPRLWEIAAAADRLYRVVCVRNDADHYEKTLRAWHSSLRSRRADAEQLVGKQTVDRYMKYLALSSVSFHTGRTGLLRLTFERIDTADKMANKQ